MNPIEMNNMDTVSSTIRRFILSTHLPGESPDTLRDDTPLALGTVWREIEAREAAEAAGMNGHQPAAVLIGAGPTKASED